MDVGNERELCRNRILSNDYRDILLDFNVQPSIWLEQMSLTPDYCEKILSKNLRILFVAASQVPPLDHVEYRYQYIPKCYGLIQDVPVLGEKAEGGISDLSTLAEAGILAVSGPPLELTGKNVIIGILDTGERVIIMSGW